eukprot:GGOE01006831.1.p2 GENE.GGOE01006831.1~~GGOE01006831.1.p2  ORF type:complete len:202 (-),score=33.89 GGOE01006831.1:970-1551(-)
MSTCRLFQRAQSPNTIDGSSEVGDWEVDDFSYDAFLFGGFQDVMPGGLPPLLTLEPTSFVPGKAPSSPSGHSSTSSQGMSDDVASNSSFRINSPNSHRSKSPSKALRSLGATPSGAHRPEPTSAARNSDPATPKQQPQGKFPLHPEGRCDHKEHWTRLRTKGLYLFFFCKYCGLGWCSLKVPKEPCQPKVCEA